MPSVSPKQHRFMEAVGHNPKFAAKVKISQAIGREFAAADAGTGFGKTQKSPQPRRKTGNKLLDLAD